MLKKTSPDNVGVTKKMHFYRKKLQKDLVESEKCSTFALAFENDAWLIRLRIRLEGWVSG